MSLVLMFPGQSSRYPGMLHKLAEIVPHGRACLEQASDTLGRDILKHYDADNKDAFACNQDVQLGVFLANHLFMLKLEEAGVKAKLSLGLSLGEWNHLVHIEAIGFEDALKAVAERGAAYDSGARGVMASVFPISLEELQEVADRVQKHGVLEVANRNSPRQQVLSGEAEALNAALEILEEEFYVEATIIEKQVPMHSSLFEPVASRFGEYLRTLPFKTPRLPYFPNRLAEQLPEPTQEHYVDLLSTHVCQPVEWMRSIDLVMEKMPDATLLEVGPKKILYNLLDRKWHKGVKKYHMDTTENTDAHIESLLENLN